MLYVYVVYTRDMLHVYAVILVNFSDVRILQVFVYYIITKYKENNVDSKYLHKYILLFKQKIPSIFTAQKSERIRMLFLYA